MFHREGEEEGGGGGRTKRRVFPVSPPGFNRKEENFSPRLPSEFLVPVRGMVPSSLTFFPWKSRRRGRTHEDSRWRGGIRPSFRRLQRLAGSIDIKKGRRGAVVGYCPCSIIMRLIQIDDCRRLFARSLRICEWRRIIRAARLSVRRSHAALHVGLIFNRRCVQNAGRYARTGSRAKPPPCPDNNQRVTPILSLLAQY